MGVVNVTPDSFSDGGRFLDPPPRWRTACAWSGKARRSSTSAASRRARAPAPVAAEEELRRVVPVIEGLAGAGTGAQLSIDTSKAAVARAALDAGATYVNDVTAFRGDPAMAGLVAERGAECCLMHMLGEPRTMQEDPRYDDVVSDVKAFLEQRLAVAVGEGVPEERVTLDPGIGFGKTLEQNLELLRRLDEIVAIGRPVLVGTSRKSFLGQAHRARGRRSRWPGRSPPNVLAYAARGVRVPRPRRRARCAMPSRWRLLPSRRHGRRARPRRRGARRRRVRRRRRRHRRHDRDRRPVAVHPPRGDRGGARGRSAARDRSAPRGGRAATRS